MFKNSSERLIITLKTSNLRSCFSPLSSHAPTIDQKEVSHFKNYTSTWWDEMGEMKPLHSMNKLRIPFIRDGLINSKVANQAYADTPQPLKGLRVLDVGCGGGLLTEPLARLGCSITGIDATKELIDLAKEHAAKEQLTNLTYVTVSVEEHAVNNKEAYDAVIASEIIEHVSNKSRFINECVHCLRPGGSIFFTTISKTFLAQIAVICVSEYVLRFVPIGTHEYEKLLQPHELQRLLEDSNCRTKIIHGMFYNYLKNSWMWMKDTSLCYALHAVKL